MPRVSSADDQITTLAKTGLEVQKEAQGALDDVLGSDAMNVDELVDLYLMANFEERMQMFTEILGSSGADGLELLSNVLDQAYKTVRAEDGGVLS